jgi:hypothetical protein
MPLGIGELAWTCGLVWNSLAEAMEQAGHYVPPTGKCTAGTPSGVPQTRVTISSHTSEWKYAISVTPLLTLRESEREQPKLEGHYLFAGMHVNIHVRSPHGGLHPIPANLAGTWSALCGVALARTEIINGQRPPPEDRRLHASLQVINEYRQSQGRPPYRRCPATTLMKFEWKDLESFKLIMKTLGVDAPPLGAPPVPGVNISIFYTRSHLRVNSSGRSAQEHSH